MIVSRGRQWSAYTAGSWICALCRHQQYNGSTRSFSGWASIDSTKAVSSNRSAAASHILKPARRHASKDVSRSKGKLPDFPARTRFAPSPTGYLHIGGLRTALFSHLLANRTNGQFLLRIEDTDQKRLVQDAEARLCQDLQWAGLQWDEGPQIGGPYGPYKQSERKEIYQKHADELLKSGTAYRCFCTPQSTGAGGSKAAYVTSGCYQDCSSLATQEAQDKAESKKETFTVRLKQPEDVHKRVCTDLIYGKIQRLKRSPSASQGGEDDSGIDAADTILVKSDGTPTYHFANVVDDHLMKITHVIRGTEWMASTPLHYDLYTAFGWEPPAFAHVGLLVDENKAKLSKRSDTGLVLDVRGMREQNGILPEVLTNFLALLGWSNPGRNDVLEMNELIRDFDLKFTKGNTVVRMEKLWYLQRQHVARKIEECRSLGDWHPVQEIINAVKVEVEKQFLTDESWSSGLLDIVAQESRESLHKYIYSILLVDSKSYQTPSQYVDRNRYFFCFNGKEVPSDREVYDKECGLTAKQLARLSRELINSTTGDFTSAEIHDQMDRLLGGHVKAERQVSEGEQELQRRHKAANRAWMRYLRDRLSYGLPGPGVGQIMEILGRDECTTRLSAEKQH